VGPARGQKRDPNLHEQYFGIDEAEANDDTSRYDGPSLTNADYYDQQQARPAQEGEKGHFI
jgi:hypothetical protein